MMRSLSALALAAGAAAKGVWTTPHDSYSSSVGVLGCKINTDRVAYWPGSIDCDKICIKLSYGGRSVHLLRIDTSGGAYDISYDAWNYLQTGESATVNPIAGGAVAMEYEEVDASECASLILTPGSKLPLSAANSINYLSSCLSQPNSWVAKNHVLYNICDAICTLGHDEECTLDLATSNQPSCPHTLGLTDKLTTTPVYNILYQTGKTAIAGSGEIVPAKAHSAPEAAPANKDISAVEYSPKPQAEAAPTRPAAPSPTAGIFVEYKTSSVAPVSYSTSAAPPVPPTTVSSAAPSYFVTAAPSHYPVNNGSAPTTWVPTTVSVVTVPNSQSTPAKASPSGTPIQSVSAGHASATLSTVALISGIIMSILGAF